MSAPLGSGKLALTKALRSQNDKLRHEAADTIEMLVEALDEAERCLADAQAEFGCKWSGLGTVRTALAKARGQ